MILAALIGCSAAKLPLENEGCKIQAYIDTPFQDYLSRRFNKGQPWRIAVIPFDVPESFASSVDRPDDYGYQLAELFQRELLKKAEGGIVEVFGRDRWPGKKEEFFRGNYTAIQLAAHAGYDLVIVGYMQEIRNESDLSFFTKVIDTESGVTVWFAETMVYSKARSRRRLLSTLTYGVYKYQPELFAFPSLSELFTQCTVERMFYPEDKEVK